MKNHVFLRALVTSGICGCTLLILGVKAWTAESKEPIDQKCLESNLKREIDSIESKKRVQFGLNEAGIRFNIATIEQSITEKKCTFCSANFEPKELKSRDIFECLECKSLVHQECCGENKGVCTTMGCAGVHVKGTPFLVTPGNPVPQQMSVLARFLFGTKNVLTYPFRSKNHDFVEVFGTDLVREKTRSDSSRLGILRQGETEPLYFENSRNLFSPTSSSFSPNGELVLVKFPMGPEKNSTSFYFRAWNTKTGKELKVARSSGSKFSTSLNGGFPDEAFFIDSYRIYRKRNTWLGIVHEVVDLRTMKVRSLREDSPYSATFTEDGSSYVLVNKDGQLQIKDTATGKVQKVYRGNWKGKARLTSDQKSLVLAGAGLWIVSGKTGEQIAGFSLKETSRRGDGEPEVSYTETGISNHLLVRSGKMLAVVNWIDGSIPFKVKSTSGFSLIQNGKRLVYRTEDNKVQIYDLESNNLLVKDELIASQDPIVLEGSKKVVIETEKGFYIVDTETGNILQNLSNENAKLSVHRYQKKVIGVYKTSQGVSFIDLAKADAGSLYHGKGLKITGSSDGPRFTLEPINSPNGDTFFYDVRSGFKIKIRPRDFTGVLGEDLFYIERDVVDQSTKKKGRTFEVWNTNTKELISKSSESVSKYFLWGDSDSSSTKHGLFISKDRKALYALGDENLVQTLGDQPLPEGAGIVGANLYINNRERSLKLKLKAKSRNGTIDHYSFWYDLRSRELVRIYNETTKRSISITTNNDFYGLYNVPLWADLPAGMKFGKQIIDPR